MAKATTKKTAKKAANKSTKKSPKKTTKKAASNRGRKGFDGKDETLVCAKLKAAYMSGASDNQASIRAGISRDSLRRYMEKNPEFRAVCNELADIPTIIAHDVQNCVMREREKSDTTFDEDGNKIEYIPNQRAIVASRGRLRAADPRYAPNKGDAPPPPPMHGGLTPEKEAEIANALKSWGEPEPTPYDTNPNGRAGKAVTKK